LQSPRSDGLVIFDCDGVLVDSEPISCRVHAEVLSRHGYRIGTDDVRARFLGRAAADIHGEIERELGRALTAAYHDELKAELMAAIARDVVAVADVEVALDQLGPTVVKCVASSGNHDKILLTLSRTGLHSRFAPHIFSATQVARGKPAPDLFLLAATAMARPARRCVVVEDSVAGISAARAAGMTAIGFVGGSHCVAGDGAALSAAGAAAVLGDIRQLAGEIARQLDKSTA
jgi:HAD superfamily hydrolase (TIGR01509 family)